MGEIKECDIVIVNNNFLLDGFAAYEDVDFDDREHIVTDVCDGAVRIKDSRYWYPEDVFDLAPLKKGDIAYHKNMGEMRVVKQEGQIVTLQKGNDERIIRIPRSELYKMKSFSKYYFDNEVEIYINNIFFKLDTRKKI